MSRSFLALSVFILLIAAPRAFSQVNAVYVLAGTTASPGAIVRVPFSIRADKELTEFSFSIDFDEEVLQAVKAEPVFQRPDGQPWGAFIFYKDNENDQPGNAGVDEGWLRGAGIFSYDAPVTLPANREIEVVAFYFKVRAGITAAVTQIRFVDGAGGQYFLNWVTPGDYGASTPAQPEAASVFVGATLKLTREVFRRGDANDDGLVDISDAVATLGYLFSGDLVVTCSDAADANDDGTVDISDPIAALGYLFLGSPRLPEPFGGCGADPTEDSLSCEAYAACP